MTHQQHVANGNILSVTVEQDVVDPHVVHNELVYASKEIAGSIFTELKTAGLLLARPTGIEPYDVVGVGMPE